MENTRPEPGWLWGPPALALIALLVSNHNAVSLISTHSGLGFGLSKYAVGSLGLPALAVIVGVWSTRHWPWLLLVGTLAKLAAVLDSHVFFFSQHPGFTFLIWSVGAAGSVLIVIGALAAARNAVMAAMVVGTQLLAAVFLGLPWLSSPLRPPAFDLLLAVVAVAGGVLAVWGTRTGEITPVEPISRRASIVGTVAAFVPTVLAVTGLLITLALPRLVASAGAGFAVLLFVTVLAAFLGRSALLPIATAGLVLFAVAAPMTLGLYFGASQLTTYGTAAVIGLAGGLVAAYFGRSTLVAAAACAGLALLMVTVVEVTGSYNDITQGGLAALIIALGVVAVTSAAATAAPVLADLRAVPVGLGVLLIGFQQGVRELVQPFLSYSRIPNQLPEQDYTSLWAWVLGIAAGALVVIAVLERRPAKVAA